MQRFDLIQQMIFSAEARQNQQTQSDPLLRRVSRSLNSLDASQEIRSNSDLIILVKQALLSCEGERREGLRVPLVPSWPKSKDWQRFGFEVSSAGIEGLFLEIGDWNPNWLDEGAGTVVLDAIRRFPRRPDRKVPADPLIESKLGIGSYLSESQRSAVQVAFMMPRGATSLIVLPTGSGKSLVFQSPLFSNAFRIGLTIVVVPTVALARDQDLRYRALPSSDAVESASFAYHSGMSDDEKLLMRRNIEDGKVRVLFTSPEALITSLRRSLFLAAERGFLNYFVVDEAHMISQWGDSFRPQFQMLAGLRDSLRDACPVDRKFRTLLLTATMTADCYDTLTSLFGAGEFHVVGDASLRSEIGFLIRNAEDEPERTVCIEEALRVLPRPLILYTTKRDDAERWSQRIHALGFRRVRLVRGGDLSDEAGEALLQDWNAGLIDIIVATSAFGLGVDQSEVRSIIHACLPESIDRFYQEVGRSGRDGRASVSLLVTTPHDAEIASDLALQTRISIDRGYQRWQEMSIHGKHGPNGTYIVSLDRKPHDIDYSGRKNASWNLRTLILMRRAGLLEFRPHLPPYLERASDEPEEAFLIRQKAAFDLFSSEVAVRFLHSGHSDLETWENTVASVRTTLRSGEVLSLERSKELMRLKRPLNDIFRETYAVPQLGLTPDRVNGNCPVARERSEVEYESGIPPSCLISPPLIQKLSETFRKSLASCSDEAGRFWILVDPLPSQSLRRRSAVRQISDFISLCVAAGANNIGLPRTLKSSFDWGSIATRSQSGFIATMAVGETLHPDLLIPTLNFIAEDIASLVTVSAVMSMAIPESIILFSSSALDPRHAPRRLIDIVPYLPLGSAISRLQV